MTTKDARDIAPGDVLVFYSQLHVIDHIEPHSHPTVTQVFGIARAADGWGITLEDGQSYEVANAIAPRS